MESSVQVLDVIMPNGFMASVDLKDAYSNLPIHLKHTKYLKISHGKKLYNFVAMLNG